MNITELKRKLTSRKLWIAVIGVIVGLAAALGIEENDWAQIAGMVTSAASVVAYIMGEAKIDAASAGKTDNLTTIPEEAEENE